MAPQRSVGFAAGRLGSGNEETSHDGNGGIRRRRDALAGSGEIIGAGGHQVVGGSEATRVLPRRLESSRAFLAAFVIMLRPSA